MDTKIKHKYCDAVRYRAPVIDKPMSREVFLKHIRRGVEKIFSRTENLLKINGTYAKALETYLYKYDIQEIVTDESFVEKIRLDLLNDGLINQRGSSYRLMTLKKISRFTRQVINEYFYPNKLVKRRLILESTRQKYERFLCLSKEAQDAICWFEENGKVVKTLPVYVEDPSQGGIPGNGNPSIRRIITITDRNLLPVPNATKIQQVLLFLRIIGKDNFKDVVEADVQRLAQYCDKRGLKKKQDYLADVATFFANIHHEGFIKSNPFSQVSLKKNAYSSVKNEFFSVEAIQKLRDISTVDMKNRLDVRDRLFALLGYDLAMRLNEILSLKVSDFEKDSDGELYVRLRSEIQKGRKAENIFYFFFDETKELLEIYLKKYRSKFTPQSDHLILAQHGTPLNSQRCRVAFKNLCERMGITTFYGKQPSPHCLRHSFATLNVEPLGLSLPLNGIMERLRHTRSEIAERHYIHDNPYLKKLKHGAYRKRIKKETSSDLLDRIPLPELEYWLSDRLGLDPSITELIRRKHKIAFLRRDKKVDSKQDERKMYISEQEAIQRLSHLGITELPLRQLALKEGWILEGGNGSLRYSGAHRYEEAFIEELVQNWVSVQSIKEKLGLPNTVFWRKAKRYNWKIKKIGRCSFVRKGDLL